jgi:uncharacterized membrane protein
MTHEHDRDRVRLTTPMLFQMLSYAGDVNWAAPALWVALVVFAVLCVIGLLLARGSWHESLR